jgi:hypothetical protein
MKRVLVGIALFLALSAGYAQIYQWKDDSGKTIISDKPPVGAARIERKIDAPPPSNPAGAAATTSTSATQKSLADRELEFRQRQKEAQESAEKARKQQQAASEMSEYCESARRQLKALESGERLGARDDKGERYFLDDAQRAQETAKTRQLIAQNCR